MSDADSSDVLHREGVSLIRCGCPAQAEPVLRRAAALAPADVSCRIDLGDALRDQGRLPEALDAYQISIALNPSADAWFRIAAIHQKLARKDEARQGYRKALELRPDFADALSNLASLEMSCGDPEACLRLARQALALDPLHPLACDNIGQALQAEGRIDEAIDYYRLSISRSAAYAGTFNDLGDALRDAGKLEDALIALEQALKIQPDFHEAQWNRALVLLQGGDFERGWAAYESRYHTRLAHEYTRDFTQPCWQGDLLGGGTVLLHAEQGFGDAIQFVRYVRQVKALGAGKIYLEVQPALTRLMRCIPDVAEVLPRGAILPEFDVHSSLMSLPHRLHTTLETIPDEIPYLRAPAPMAAAWQDRMRSDRKLRVGLVWCSNVANKAIHARKSILLRQLEQLGECAGVSFYSLQKGEGCSEIAASGFQLVDWSDDLKDFCDTAAFIENLDLVISVDTAVAHLAGAIGKPVWLLLCHSADWRWLQNRNDSPWYPTMRIFRQDRGGDWTAPLARVRIALADAAHQVAAGQGFSNPPPPVQDMKTDPATMAAALVEKDAGNTAYGEGDPGEAERHYRQAIALNPEYAEARNNLALVLRARKEDLEAEIQLLRALAAKPDLVNARFNLACLFADQGRGERAIEEFRRVLDLDPEHAEARIELDELLRSQGESDAIRTL